MNKKRYIMPKAKAVKLKSQRFLTTISNPTPQEGTDWGDDEESI